MQRSHDTENTLARLNRLRMANQRLIVKSTRPADRIDARRANLTLVRQIRQLEAELSI